MNKLYCKYISLSGFRLIPHTKNNVILINRNTQSEQIQDIDEFLKPYLSQNETIFNINSYKQCIPENIYGYADEKPCIFLKFHNHKYWKPEPYRIFLPDNASYVKFPQEAPSYIREYGRKKLTINGKISDKNADVSKILDIYDFSYD